MGLPLEDKKIDSIPSSSVIATLDDFYNEETRKVKIGMHFILQSFVDDHFRWEQLDSIDTLQKILPWINQRRCWIKPTVRNEGAIDKIMDHITFDFEDL